MELKNIHDTIKNVMYVEDTDLIDVLLAIFLSRKQSVIKLWMILIDDSGGGKSLLLSFFEGSYTKTLMTITPNTLVNGKKSKNSFFDLAPMLKNKVVLIPEFAQLLSLHPDAKRQVWSQLRDLFDGKAGKTSAECDTKYKNLNVSLVACSTEAIDKQLLLNNDLGTREFIYRAKKTNDEELMNIIIRNTNDEQLGKKELEIRKSVKEFLKNKKLEDIILTSEIESKIQYWAMVVCKLRAVANANYNTGDLNGNVAIEKPTRILKQFIILYKCLKSLDENYSDEVAIRIIKHISLSTCVPNRRKILVHLLSLNEEVSCRDIRNEFNIGKNTAMLELNVLTALDLVKKKSITIDEEKDTYYYRYTINNGNPIVSFLKKELGIELDVIEEVVR